METHHMLEFKFPIGYERFHRNQLFNYQLNRPYSFGYARFEDLKEIGQGIRTFADWKRVMIHLAENAVLEGRLLSAAFYYRAAEFYTKSTAPEKAVLYDKFSDLFYKAIETDEIEKHLVPHDHSYLSGLRIPSNGAKKGVIVIHGGFDSFIEEFYSIMRYFSNRGYHVIGFDGPGQGATLRKFGLPITYEWEKPVKSVLDYFHLDDVTIIGISMGGWFCLRAAAFESRIRRVIATGHAIDYMKSMPLPLRGIHIWCMKHWPRFMNQMAEMKFKYRKGMESWVVDHLKFITGKSRPLEAMDLYVQLNDTNIRPELVKQDVLILTGKNDHIIPFKMHEMQLKALVNARSVTGRVFSKEEHADNHCQIGNIALALQTMTDWIESVKM